jgi:IclR family transcriptional regulator, KDG regulon repressor
VAQTIETTKNGGASSTVLRAVSLLEALAGAPPEGMGVTEISKAIGANRSTVYRILGALRPLGYIREGAEPGTVLLGFRVVELGERVLGQIDIRKIAGPHLRELAQITEETCHLAVIDGLDVVYADKAESEQSIRLFSVPGKRMPIYCTAMGKAMLAAMGPGERAAILDQVELVPRSANTVTDRAQLDRDLEETAERGYSLDLGENELGTRCVGAAILDREDRPVAAFSASGPESRMCDEWLVRQGNEVKRMADLVSRELGREA